MAQTNSFAPKIDPFLLALLTGKKNPLGDVNTGQSNPFLPGTGRPIGFTPPFAPPQDQGYQGPPPQQTDPMAGQGIGQYLGQAAQPPQNPFVPPAQVQNQAPPVVPQVDPYPNRSDYVQPSYPLQPTPQFVAPERNTAGEGKSNALGGSLAALLAVLSGNRQFAGQAAQSYLQGAKGTQDANYTTAYNKAGDVYKNQAQAVQDANQNITRKEKADNDRYGDAVTQANYEANQQTRRDAETDKQKGAASLALARKNTFLTGLRQLDPAGRAARVNLMTPEELTAYGFKPDGSDLLPAVADMNSARYKTPAQVAEGERIKNLRAEAAQHVSILNNQFATPEAKAKSAARLAEIKKYTGIGIGDAATPGMAMSAAQSASVENAKKNTDLHGQSVELVRKGLQLRNEQFTESKRQFGDRFGLAEKQFSDLQARTAASQGRADVNSLRQFDNTVDRLNKDIDGTNGLRKDLSEAESNVRQSRIFLQSGKNAKGEDLTDGMKAMIQQSIADDGQRATEIRQSIQSTKKRIGEYQQFRNKLPQAPNTAYNHDNVPVVTVKTGDGKTFTNGNLPAVTLPKPMALNGPGGTVPHHIMRPVAPKTTPTPVHNGTGPPMHRDTATQRYASPPAKAAPQIDYRNWSAERIRKLPLAQRKIAAKQIDF